MVIFVFSSCRNDSQVWFKMRPQEWFNKATNWFNVTQDWFSKATDWFKMNNMVVNQEKFQAIVIDKKRTKQQSYRNKY